MAVIIVLWLFFFGSVRHGLAAGLVLTRLMTQLCWELCGLIPVPSSILHTFRLFLEPLVEAWVDPFASRLSSPHRESTSREILRPLPTNGTERAIISIIQTPEASTSLPFVW